MTDRQIDAVYDELIKEGKGGEHIRDYIGYAMDRTQDMILDVVIDLLVKGDECPCAFAGGNKFCADRCGDRYSEEQERKCWRILIDTMMRKKEERENVGDHRES